MPPRPTASVLHHQMLYRLLPTVAALAVPFLVLPWEIAALCITVCCITVLWCSRRMQLIFNHLDALCRPGAGAPIRLLEAAKVFCSSFSIVNNSALAKMEYSLKEYSEKAARYTILTDHLAAAVVIRDSTGRATYCSPYTEVLTGYALEEIYKAKSDFFLSIAHEEDEPLLRRALKVAACGEPFQYRARFFHKTGIEMWAETRTVPIVGDNAIDGSSLSIMLDVTGTLRYQKQVEDRNRDLHDFTYMITHDLKAPILTVQGMARVIREDTADTLSTKISDPLLHIENAANRLESLVSSMLRYARIAAEEISFEAVDLRTIIPGAIEDHTELLRQSAAKIEYPQEPAWVVGDPLKLHQIFSNLIGNAIKYGSPQRDPIVRIQWKPQGPRMMQIKVIDNGCGIPDDQFDRIFRPFQRLHGNEIEGSGIGLACVQQLLRKIGGSIKVTSELGDGSQFIVTLSRALNVEASDSYQAGATDG